MKPLNFIQIAFFICISILIASCKKTDEKIAQVTTPNINKLNELREIVLISNSLEKVIDTDEGISFTTQKGTEVTIYPNTMVDSDDNPFSGSIKLNIIDLFDRGTMAVTNKALMAKDNQGNIVPLITGGQIFTSITSNNNIAKVGFGNFYNVKIPSVNTGGIDTDMLAWKGTINEDDNLIYEQVDPWSHDVIFSTPSINIGTYDLHLSKFGWFNIDKFYTYQGNTTKIKVKVPTIYNKTNSSIYVTYKAEPEVLAQLPAFDNTTSTFTENYGFSPIGIVTNIIFISESNGNFAYTIKQFTTQNNQEVEIQLEDVQEISAADLINRINNLN